jgi:hypothetical protein
MSVDMSRFRFPAGSYCETFAGCFLHLHFCTFEPDTKYQLDNGKYPTDPAFVSYATSQRAASLRFRRIAEARLALCEIRRISDGYRSTRGPVGQTMFVLMK